MPFDVGRKVLKTYRNEGLKGVLYKVSAKIGGQSSETKLKRLFEPPYQLAEELYREPFDQSAIRRFQNIHKDKRCFIIGNGPSLNKVDLSLLENEYTFAVNGIFYKTRETGFKPTYYVVEDSHVMKDNLETIKDYFPKAHRFFPLDYKHLLEHTTDRTSYFNMNVGFYEKSSPNYKIPRFSTDAAARLYCGQSVTIINLQLAYYMGFSEVYLIGMDFSYAIPTSAKIRGTSITSTEDDPNHFHPEYFGKGKSWHDPELDKVLLSYKMCDLVYSASGRRIFNATVGGALELFPRVDYTSLFNGK